MLVDSHCHLDRVDLTPYGGRFPDLMNAIRDSGVGHMLCVCIDLEDFDAMRARVAGQPDVSISVGVHPNEQGAREPTADELMELAANTGAVAIGETGLDYHYTPRDLDWQRERVRVHIDAARRSGLPLIIHTRDARDDTIAIMRDAGAAQAGGVMHCFTETWEMAEQALELGFYISFSGIVTFKNAESLRDVARRVPLERLLIETDSPYLAPKPFRGKRNESSYLTYIVEKLSEVYGLEKEQIAEITTQNALEVFNG